MKIYAPNLSALKSSRHPDHVKHCHLFIFLQDLTLVQVCWIFFRLYCFILNLISLGNLCSFMRSNRSYWNYLNLNLQHIQIYNKPIYYSFQLGVLTREYSSDLIFKTVLDEEGGLSPKTHSITIYFVHPLDQCTTI